MFIYILCYIFLFQVNFYDIKKMNEVTIYIYVEKNLNITMKKICNLLFAFREENN